MVIFNCYVWLEGFCGHFHPCLACFDVIPSGKLSHNYRKSMKITIFHEIPISHEKWWFSIVMTVYQRVTCSFFRCPNSPQGASDRRGHGPTRQRGPDASKPGLGGGHRAAEPEGAGAAGGGRTAWCLGNPWETLWVIHGYPSISNMYPPSNFSYEMGRTWATVQIASQDFFVQTGGVVPPILYLESCCSWFLSNHHFHFVVVYVELVEASNIKKLISIL